MRFSKKITEFLKQPNFMVLGTFNPRGTIQMTPVWYMFDEAVFRFSTTTDRVKHRNLSKDPRVTFVIYDNQNPYRYVQIRGKITDSTKKGGHDFIDTLAKHYLEKDRYPFDLDRKLDRITYTITPKRSQAFGF
ncbi:PPOX class F420-dependent oxidoreductase [Patescibacteria group bacterium]|nr:PPOX class F420-dependent oxidoreductase [Patescibacteria group bacterium]